jgi:hypothetical protein
VEATRVADSYAPLVSDGVEFTPAASAQYWPDETLFVYFEINNPSTRNPAQKYSQT